MLHDETKVRMIENDDSKNFSHEEVVKIFNITQDELDSIDVSIE